MKRVDSDLTRLADILNAIETIEEIVSKPNRERHDVFAVAYMVAIIGEASSKVSEATRISNKYIEWRDIIDTRNRIIHEYGKLNESFLWQLVSRDLPKLKQDILLVQKNIIEGIKR